MADTELDADSTSVKNPNPVVPTLLEGDHEFNFRCYKGIDCFNACCSNIDITLTPYDIIRLKNRLELNSAQFLQQYAVPYEMEKDGIAGVKLKPVDEGTQCRFMTDEGCSVYEDRPTACRYYPVALVSMRKQDEYTDSNYYALVEEEHCHGHQDDRRLTIDEYREEQGLEEYDRHTRGWRQLILKKKSGGPAIGTPPKKSRQLFFMTCYNIDEFRLFVNSDGFKNSFKLDDETYERINADETELLEFGYRLLRQVLFGEMTIEVSDEAAAAMSAKAQTGAEDETAEREAAWEPPELT